MTYRVLAVCTGNICRSPMAEAVLRDRFAAAGLDVDVDSAGVSDEETGNPIDPRAAAVLSAAGYAVPRHRAQQVTRESLAQAGLVLAMTATHAAALRRLAPEAAGRVVLVRRFDPATAADAAEREIGIRDPWYGDRADFEETLQEIEAAADGVVERVRAEFEQRR